MAKKNKRMKKMEDLDKFLIVPVHPVHIQTQDTTLIHAFRNHEMNLRQTNKKRNDPFQSMRYVEFTA